MKKAILISIHPKWCELIKSGKKTIEIRRNRPTQGMPIKVYIYETKSEYVKSAIGARTKYGYGQGKIIGEFVCGKIDTFTCGIPPFGEISDGYGVFPPELEKMCLNYNDLIDYGAGAPLYGWHLSELKIYDQPKEVREFIGWNRRKAISEYRYLKMPPQSWCYVQEVE